MSQGMHIASTSRKRLETDSSPGPPEERQPSQHLDFGPVKAISDFSDLQNFQRTNLYCFKLLSYQAMMNQVATKKFGHEN